MSFMERTVSPADWLTAHEEAKSRGLEFFDFMSAMDLGDGRTGVVTHVMRPDATEREMLTVELDAGQSLPSLSTTYRGATWHEREAHDLLGVSFVDHGDLRPLITDEHPPPLRRDAALTPRVVKKWPGLYEPGAAQGETRRKRPKPVPGVNPQWASPLPHQGAT